MAELTRRKVEKIKFSDLSKEYDKATRNLVLQRDKLRCVLCGAKGVHVHEIVPRSHFGKQNVALCFEEKNRACLCPQCHEDVHNPEARTILLTMMKQVHGYVYEEEQFRKYIDID